ncbi:NAD(P)/FAD-dependent oxidoreductase [Cerasicoccus frondis]|uniref:NAD(P)/FAD-dependent oxidoreductase n=1 Tax=Cerasicoccus frondis TaxID=490090 RepID=UPI0028525D40|nr:NAD(P)/FAD-dependent oxidoreductase [Cerasicoccus frondis]
MPQFTTTRLNTIATDRSDAKRPHIVILGGGFAGLSAAKALADCQAMVTLIDRENHHLFQPLLYQVATAGLSAADIAQPLRHILEKQKNLMVIMDEVQSIELSEKRVCLKSSALDYDYLIVALGVQTSYFGNADWAKHAPGLKTLDEATEIRRRVLLAYENAEKAADSSAAEAALNFVVVGGGPTGVELAGAISELSRFVLAREFHRIDPAKAKVHLIEAGPRLLPAFDPKQSQYTLEVLQKMGVSVHLDTMVTNIEEGTVTTSKETIESSAVLWAAGVESGKAARTLNDVERDRAGRIIVNSNLAIPEHASVYVVGDLASFTPDGGRPVPGVAPAALQMGAHAAMQIKRQLDGQTLQPFAYHDKGSMATIGRSSAVAQFGKRTINGVFAWVLWLMVHLLFLVGMKNRLTVFHHWVWSYFTWQVGARIITKKRIY